MEDDNQVEESRPSGPFLIFSIFVVSWVLFTFFVLFPTNARWIDDQQKPLSLEKDIGLNEVLKISKRDLEHENLLYQIREDLKIPKDEEVKIFIGPYDENIIGEGRLISSNQPFGFILLLNETFYQKLTPEEKIALISHELGHLTNRVIIVLYNLDTLIRFQIEADTYATKYASPEAMISLLNKANDKHGNVPSREYFLRIQNLEKIRQLKQGQ